MKRFSTRLYTSPHYKPKEEIQLTVEFINDTGQPVYVSKNISEAFKIGDAKKLLKPKEKNKGRVNHPAFFRVPANSSIIKKVNLGKQPGLKPGTHSLLFELKSLLVRKGKSIKGKAPGSRQKLKSIRTHILVEGSKPTAKVSIEKSAAVNELFDHPGIAELMQPTLLTRRLPEGLVPPRICRVIGGSQQQQDIVRAAHEDGYVLAVAALSNIGNASLYQTWFGLISDVRFRRVQGAFRHIVDAFRHETFVYDLSGTDCGENEIGHTTPGSRTIHFCNTFWTLPPRGSDSMAGRIVHEHSHAVANTLDAAFSFNACVRLARDFPAQAVENASNYQFFAEG